MQFSSINMNDHVYVKPNENTLSCVVKYYQLVVYPGRSDAYNIEDAKRWFKHNTVTIDGEKYLKMQLHEFVKVFASATARDFFNNSIHFDSSELVGGNKTNTQLLADIENIRRHAAKEKAELEKNANTKLLTSLTEVYDDLDRAFYGSTWGKSAVVFAEGIHKIFGKFKKILADYGLEQYSPEHHAEFNPEEHEAICCTQSQQPIPVPSNCYITDVMQKGYKVFGKVIKHAKVVVSNL